MVILWDVSLSMSADDVEPSRFDLAKISILQLLQETQDMDIPISVIWFSGIPLPIIPFSTDTDAISHIIEQYTLADFPPTPDFLGTAIGDSLVVAIDRLTSVHVNDTSYGTILLITDGDSSIWVDPLSLIWVLRDAGIVIHALALGEDEYALWRDTQQKEVIAYLDMETLQTLTEETGWSLVHVTSALPNWLEISRLIQRIDTANSWKQTWWTISLRAYVLWLLYWFLVLYMCIKIYVYMRLKRYLTVYRQWS